jgi:RNA polymerase primary sigma factor
METTKSWQVTISETIIGKYLQEIGKVDLITADEEVELAQKIKAGDQKVEKLKKANLRFVVRWLNNTKSRINTSDLINEGI